MSCRLLEKYFAEKHGSSIDKSFRGIPIGMSLYDSLNFVYGSLRISTYDSSCLIITSDSRVDEEKRSFTWSRVSHKSVGEFITNGIYEGDILIHEDYPKCLFELQYINGGWKPCVIYGSEGTPELSGFPRDLREYSVHSWKYEHYLWYADYSLMRVKKPREDLIFLGSIEKDTDNLYLTPGDDGIFRNSLNIFYESDMGDYGKIIITETIFAENFHTCTYPEKTIKDAIEWNPVVGDLLRKRKLISF